MEVWSHDGKLYDVASGYSLPADAWEYELMGLTGPPGTGPHLSVSIPDATPDGAFTPMTVRHVAVRLDGGTLPWPVLERLILLLESSGDLVEERGDEAGVRDVRLSADGTWSFGSRRFEVTGLRRGDTVSRRCTLHEVGAYGTGGAYIEAGIPSSAPAAGDAALTVYGRWSLPWPVFRRFVDAVRTAGEQRP